MANNSGFPDRERFNLSHRFFDMTVPEWTERTSQLRSKKLRILELGSFEGGSTTWMLDNMMDHPESTLDAVDIFTGNMEHQDDPEVDYKLNTLENRFWENVRKCPASDRLRFHKATTDEALLKLRAEGAVFDFVYIDASHTAIDVLHDAIMVWKMLADGGIMVFDDYDWYRYNEESYCPPIAIDAFVRSAAPEIEASPTKTQMWVKRVPRHIFPTANTDRSVMYWGHKNWTEEDIKFAMDMHQPKA